MVEIKPRRPGGGPRGPAVKLFLLAVLLATVLVVTMTTAAAVTAAPALADVAGADPPDVVLEEDGTLVFGGDLATDCPSFAGGVERGELYGADDPEQARSALELCRQGGFLPSDGSAAPSSPPDPATADATATADSADDEESAAATAEADDEESATASTSAEPEALPDTGGVSPALLAVLPALLLVGTGVMAFRVFRRN